jgi:ABC-type multidrug transport system permease subunit
MLRIVGGVLKVLAWIVLVLAALAAIGAGVSGVLVRQFVQEANGPAWMMSMGNAGGIAVAIGIFLTGLIYFLFLYAAGDFVFLQLAVEENTRLTAALLLKLDEESSAVPSDDGGLYGSIEQQ